MEPRNPTSAFFFFQNQMQFFFFFFFFQTKFIVSRALEPTFGMAGAKHTQTDTHDRFAKSLYLLRL